jgi:addiction module HigA family antidote
MIQERIPQFLPDYASAPGELIAEYLEDLGYSARQLARLCGRSPKLIAEIVTGKAPIEPETALQLERVLGLDASVWMGMEAQYRLRLAMEAEERELAECESWLRTFPLKDLQERGQITLQGTIADRVKALLRYFGAGSVEACRSRFKELLASDYRTSPAFSNNVEALVTWLRLGERGAANLPVGEFDRTAFVTALTTIRGLTRCPVEDAVPCMQQLCANAGVAFVVELPFKGVRVSGVSRWLAPDRALIQQSFRHRSNDHFWFTFFHEAAHLLLHSKKEMFIDSEDRSGSAEPEQEREANDWATEFLVPSRALERFIQGFNFKDAEVIAFADEHGIAPGIVVGQLQHRKVLRFNQMKHLQEYYDRCELATICTADTNSKIQKTFPDR